MSVVRRVAPWVFVLVIVAGCATTEVTKRQAYTGERLARPDRIIVYDFAATRADLPAWSAAASRYGQQVDTGTTETIETGSAVKRMVLGFGSGAAELTTTVEGYQMTNRGLRLLGSGEVQSAGGKAPGVAIPLAVAVASGNPIGLAIGSAAKIEGQVSGRTTIEGAGKRTAEKIAGELRGAFQRQGWI